MDIFRVETTGKTGGLRLVGELDISGVEALSEAIAGLDGQTPLTLDLTQLDFLDSTGLRELLKAATDNPERPVRLISPSQIVYRVLEIAGVLSAFEVVGAPRGDPG